MISGDWHPIHADETYARDHGLKGRLFHGAFGLFIAFGMATTLPHFGDEVVGATGIREWTYRRPLFVGDTVHMKASITNKRVTSDGRRAVIERSLALINQDGSVVQDGIAGTMIRLAQRSG
jgi:acyl dehydratase